MQPHIICGMCARKKDEIERRGEIWLMCPHCDGRVVNVNGPGDGTPRSSSR